MFGYAKEELCGKNMSLLMPDLYAKRHADVLRSKKGFQMGKDDIFILCQHRCKYIFPGYLKILRMANMLNSFTYVAAITEKTAFTDSSKTYVLLNPELSIVGLSSRTLPHLPDYIGAWTMLGITNSWIKEGELNLTAVCPAITAKTLRKYMNKAWSEVDYVYPRRKVDANELIMEEPRESENVSLSPYSPISDHTLRPSGSPSHAMMQGRTRLKFTAGTITMLGDELLGYYGIFSACEEQPESGDQSGTGKLDKANKASDFQFRFDQNQHIFVRELNADSEGALQRKMSLRSACRAIARQPSMYQDNDAPPSSRGWSNGGSESSSRKGSFYWIQEAKIRLLSRFINGMQNTHKEVEDAREFVENYIRTSRPDYGEDVRTYRLLNGNFVEVNETVHLQMAIEEAGTRRISLIISPS